MAQHVRIPPRCAICDSLFEPKDHFYIFVARSPNSAAATRFSGHGEFRYPDSAYFEGNKDSESEPWFCCHPMCRQCPESAESSALHADCLRLFLGLSHDFGVGLRQLWVAMSWKNPWKGAPTCDLAPLIDIRIIGEIPGLSQWKSLPLEISTMIRARSSSRSLWYCSILSLRAQLSDSKNLIRQSIHLTKINSWNRGESPDLRDRVENAYFRLVFDSRGLRCIQALSERPLGSNSSSEYFGYILEPAERFSNVVVDFALGLAQMRAPGGYHIWDTPCPPSLDSTHNVLTLPPSGQLGTVHIGRCFGITFFLAPDGSILAIHTHTPSRPTAHRTLLGFSTKHQTSVAWVYIPIEGELQEFSFSQLPSRAGSAARLQCLVLGLEHVGKVFVGPYRIKPTRFTQIKRPLTLIYRKREVLPITFVGGYSPEYGVRSIKAPLHNPTPPPSLRKPHFSSAPLAGACKIRIFFIPGTEFCRGIMIHYDTGRRALGQCRLGADSIEDHTLLSSFCFLNTTYQRADEGRTLHAVRVGIFDQYHQHQEVGWTCCTTAETLNFWFTIDEAVLEHCIDE
ncbi:hypothetical protein HIM_10582 [Hirsutella minnesotensis 3608]|uniref:Uncharacterized protein n=1 Tax=Hirsutella minnesotensis 3608 TaxID=1043627 RepID=A0A0F7ZG01_9HYPO|nr:hypothetical protein HIM_10582 [Hirsutella minnesotensis 3608]